MLYIFETESRGAGERRCPVRAGDAPELGPGHRRELLRREHAEAAKAEDTDAAHRVKVPAGSPRCCAGMHRCPFCFRVARTHELS